MLTALFQGFTSSHVFEGVCDENIGKPSLCERKTILYFKSFHPWSLFG